MTGNNSGWVDPGIYAQPPTSGGTGQPQPTQWQTNDAYNQYGLHHYNGNVQNLNQVDQSTSQSDQSKYGPLFGPILHLINGQNEVHDKLSATAKNLKQGLDIRTAPPGVAANYPGMSHQQLYDSVHQGVDPAAVGSVSNTWLDIGNKLANLQGTVAQAIASSQVTWSGHAAEQARQSIAALGNKSGQAGQSAQLAGVLMAQQSEALTTAKNSVPPPPNPPFNAQAAQQQLQTITNPVAFATQAATDQAQALAQQAAHQQAAHVVQQYDQTVSQTSVSMPAFAPAPPVAKPGPPSSTPVPPTGPPPPHVGGVPPRFGTGPNPGSHTPSPGTGTPGHTGEPGNGGPNPITWPNGPTGTGNQTTSTSGVGPTSPGTFNNPTGTTGNPFGNPGNLPSTGSPGGFHGYGGLPGGLTGLGGGGGGAGSGSGLGSRSGLGGSGSGAGGSGSSSGASGGGRSGVGAGAAAAEQAAMREGAVGGRGAAGTPGAGGMGAGRGQKGQDDAEHKRPSWLVEQDEGIFGTDEMTAPPVIGE